MRPIEKDGVKVKILGICGSPRKNGNTEFLLAQALEAAKSVNHDSVETESYSIAGKKYLPCISCFNCIKLGYCIRSKDDDFEELRNKWMGADGIIMATPVYHMGLPGQLKCFIDRLGNSMNVIGKHLKVYGAIVQGVHIFSGEEHTLTQIINHALLMGNVVISGDYWESYIGAAGWTENRIEKDSLKKLFEEKSFDAEAAVRASRSIGKRVAQLALIIKVGALYLIDYLKDDPYLKPFISRIKR
jgi:multimeric flavodoxin WrbA